jgi:hypothetical protein
LQPFEVIAPTDADALNGLPPLPEVVLSLKNDGVATTRTLLSAKAGLKTISCSYSPVPAEA